MQHIEADDVTIAELDALWQRRRRALARRAAELLAQPALRMALGPTLAERDLDALAWALVAPLMDEKYGILPIPALHAMIAIEIDRMKKTGHWAEGDL